MCKRSFKVIVVSDSGPLIALANIGQLDLLSALYGEILIPKAVYEEVVKGGQGRPGSKEVRETKRRGLIPSVTLLLDQLLAAGVRISRRLYRYAQQLAGEERED
jgi:predicted nucleic acid-binding protein